jgi:hypothetical protein
LPSYSLLFSIKQTHEYKPYAFWTLILIFGEIFSLLKQLLGDFERFFGPHGAFLGSEIHFKGTFLIKFSPRNEKTLDVNVPRGEEVLKD